MQLLTPYDLTRARMEALFARADEIQNGAAPRLSQKRVALALSYLPAPFPIDLAKTCRDEKIECVTLASGPTPAVIAREIRAANAACALVSHAPAGSVNEIATLCQTPVLNAGDGIGENPLRALMDAYAIYTLQGALQNLRIGLLGNLKFAAEAHSLARVLGLFESRLSFITPAALSMPYDLTDDARATAYEVEETNDLAATLKKTDALVLFEIDATRVEEKIYAKLKTFYTLTPATFVDAKEGLVILGAWNGAEELLAPTRPQAERAARAILLALIEA